MRIIDAGKILIFITIALITKGAYTAEYKLGRGQLREHLGDPWSDNPEDEDLIDAINALIIESKENPSLPSRELKTNVNASSLESGKPNLKENPCLSQEETVQFIRAKIDEKVPHDFLIEQKQLWEKQDKKKASKSCRIFNNSLALYPEHLLGAGAMAKVYLGLNLIDGSPLAVKVFKNTQKKAYENQKTSEELFKAELEILERIHRNLYHYMSDDELIIFMPYEGIPLFELPPNMPESFTYEIIIGLMKKIYELHKHGIWHLDLKPDNILISHSGTGSPKISLIDYGDACLNKNKPFYKFIGTKAFLPLEALTNEPHYGSTTDIYGLGLQIIYLLAGIKSRTIPFQNEVQDFLFRLYFGSFFEPFASPIDYLRAALRQHHALCVKSFNLRDLAKTDPMHLEFLDYIEVLCERPMNVPLPDSEKYLRTAFFYQVDLAMKNTDLSYLSPLAVTILKAVRSMVEQNWQKRMTDEELGKLIEASEKLYEEQFKLVDNVIMSQPVSEIKVDAIGRSKKGSRGSLILPLNLHAVSAFRKSDSNKKINANPQSPQESPKKSTSPTTDSVISSRKKSSPKLKKSPEQKLEDN